MIVRNADLNGQLVDLHINAGRIAKIGPHIPNGPGFDAKGGAVIPGLHDHHIHLNATAAAMASIPCGPPNIIDETALKGALNQSGEGWLRGVGYHQSVAGEIDRVWLDDNGPDRPVRIQHRSGRLWILNSLAIEELKISNPNNGRLYDSDLSIRKTQIFPDLRPLIQRLISYGITGVTEVTPSNSVAEFENYVRQCKPLKFRMMGNSNLSSSQSSHLKLHYHEHDLPSLESLVSEIKGAHVVGRNIAAHCVTRAELMLTLAAIEIAGPVYGDRIEHAAIADIAALEWMKKLGVIVVTQPNFISERKEAYLKDVPSNEHENLWRLNSFANFGLPMAAGSDAPFGDPNPWAAMHAAVNRPIGFEHENITPEEALSLYTKPAEDAGAAPRKIKVGSPADFNLLNVPWSDARKNLAKVSVRATWIGGELVYNLVN